jgi:hypothetical protein
LTPLSCTALIGSSRERRWDVIFRVIWSPISGLFGHQLQKYSGKKNTFTGLYGYLSLPLIGFHLTEYHRVIPPLGRFAMASTVRAIYKDLSGKGRTQVMTGEGIETPPSPSHDDIKGIEKITES